MRCPTLTELPPPPPGKTGWPWTEESRQLPDAMPDGKPWPRISIVTPSYNQGQFIEETIRSILLQGYPSLEYIIMDGDSTDGTLDVIRKYAPWLTYWESVNDLGQAHAINKGLAQSTGEIFQWINSDDLLFPGCLCAIASGINGYDLVAGTVVDFDTSGNCRNIPNTNLTAANAIERYQSWSFHQPGVWLRKDRVSKLGGFNEALTYVFDIELLIRYLAKWPEVAYTNKPLVKFRLHPNSKTVSQQQGFDNENIIVRQNLARMTSDRKIRKSCQKYWGIRVWHEKVAAILAEKEQSRILRACKLALFSMFFPRFRLNRFTLGAIKRVILN